MNNVQTGIQAFGEVSCEIREALRETLLHAYATFGVYRKMFGGLGISREGITRLDPLHLLQELPLLQGETFRRLAEEALLVGDRIVDVETSSGTTGPRKRRFISHADDLSETRFLAELFGVCGIGRSDSVACVDVDPLAVGVSFARALDLLGVQEAYTYCVGPDPAIGVRGLAKLDPSVIVTVPSIIEGCFESLEALYAGMPDARLSKLVYVGEPLPPRTRRALETALGVEVFGYYGASETSALGIECSAHDGIHLFTDRFITEMVPDGLESRSGQIVVTTLRQEALPLLRYALGDTIQVKAGECHCGLRYPRVEVTGRVGDSISVLGAEIGYDGIMAALCEPEDGPGFMQLVLTREGRDRMTIVIPESQREQEAEIRERLFRGQPDLDFLVAGEYIELEFSFVDERFIGAARKRKRIADLR